MSRANSATGLGSRPASSQSRGLIGRSGDSSVVSSVLGEVNQRHTETGCSSGLSAGKT